MKKLMTAIIFSMFLVACGGEAGTESSVALPECVPQAYPADQWCAKEGLTGEYRLAAFGLEQISTGFIIYDEMDYWPFYGTMTIDEWQLTRRISKTPSTYNIFSQDSYTFYVDGRLWGPGNNGKYTIDGAFVILRWEGNHYIGSTNWGRCWRYEYWERMADF